ncbi:unnamed protein product [Linum tenue]|uniref:Uncharacterized protein n=1 Tax=Linum tenue TaxID=586396 RepID=A0AAV0IMI1_9ROSI|nr:unnamed protein product [Linum tenue]
MVTVECLDVGMTTLSKAAMSKGMSHFVFVVYSNALATLIMFPSSFFLACNRFSYLTFPSILFLFSLEEIRQFGHFVFLHRKTVAPIITYPLIWKFFLLGLFG